MGINYEETCEITFGLLLKGKLSMDSVRPEMFIAPYNRGVEVLKKERGSIEAVATTIGFTPVQAALDAASTINGVVKPDFVAMLEKAYLQYKLSVDLEKISRKLRDGEEVETAQVIEKFNQLDAGVDRMISMDKVTMSETSFMPLGWEAFDKELQGMPISGLIVTAGSPKVGKTSYLAKKMARFVKQYPTKFGAIFTMEMFSGEYKKRALEVEKLTEEQMSRIIICEEIMPVEEVSNLAARIQDIGYVGVDFADLMIRDENNESEMGKIYRVLQNLAKRLHIPVELLAQLSRSYTGGLPRPYHIRYTSMAEALAWQIIMLYNPNTDFRTDTTNTLPQVPDKAYILHWASRGGIKKHPFPGAMQMCWNGTDGWGNESKGWFELKG
jgi:hypothetical protein